MAGAELYHVRVYAPDEEWVDGVIREAVWTLLGDDLDE
jgi:hypothetical protein